MKKAVFCCELCGAYTENVEEVAGYSIQKSLFNDIIEIAHPQHTDIHACVKCHQMLVDVPLFKSGISRAKNEHYYQVHKLELITIFRRKVIAAYHVNVKK